MRVLVTGGSGFIGAAVIRELRSDVRVTVVASTRRRPAKVEGASETVFVGGVDADTNWNPALKGVRIVVHLAARVHQVRDTAKDKLGEFRRVNVAGTLRLARQAATAGVRRFVFLSSAKVHGDGAIAKKGGVRPAPYRETDPPKPQDPYAVSKHEAEEGLRAIGAETGMEIVIIRPPLVYGPGVGANFRKMLHMVKSGIPLPFASVDNRRSLVGIDNLVDFITVCMEHPAAANQTFLVSDGEDLSTRRIIERLAAALGTRARLFSVPQALLIDAANTIRRPGLALRLLGSLQVDITKAKTLLGWKPPVTVGEGFRRVAASYLV